MKRSDVLIFFSDERWTATAQRGTVHLWLHLYCYCVEFNMTERFLHSWVKSAIHGPTFGRQCRQQCWPLWRQCWPVCFDQNWSCFLSQIARDRAVSRDVANLTCQDGLKVANFLVTCWRHVRQVSNKSLTSWRHLRNICYGEVTGKLIQ